MDPLAPSQPDLHPAPVSESNLPATDYRYATPEFEDSADLRDYLEVVLRRKWLVLTILLGVFITTLIVTLSMKPVFQANGDLELSPKAMRVTKFEDVMASQLQTREFIQTQVKLLQSHSLADRVIDKMNLVENPLFNKEPGLLGAWKQKVAGWLKPSQDKDKQDPQLAQLQKQKDVQKWFLDNLQVQPERDTTLVNLSFNSTDPVLAQHVLNTLIKQFINWHMDKRLDAAGQAKKQLDKQLQVARVQLEKSETALNQYAQKAGIVSLDSKLNLVYRQLEEVNKALAAAQADYINKKSLYEQSRQSNVSSLPMVINNQLIQNLRQSYVEAAAQYNEMLAIYKPDHPKMKNLQAKMDDIHAKIQAEENRILSSIKDDYLTAQKTKESLKKAAAHYKALALSLNNRATQYKILQRDVQTNKQIYQSLLERGKEIDANVGTDLSNVSVVDYASLPLKPFKPNIRLDLLLAIVVGLMGGVGVAFVLEYFDNTVKRMEEITERFQIPVLGVIPLAEAEAGDNLDRLVGIKPRSSFAEAVRSTKVSIELSSYMDETPKTLLMTSIGPGEGKSTISANLAQAFATSEEKVVLLDCDLRKPRLHKTFCNGHKTMGLSQFLSGICKAEELLLKTETPNLYFISAGPIPPNPAEMLASNRMKLLLQNLSKYFDRVILDGPPAMGFADVLALGHFVNGVILVNNLGETPRDGLRTVRSSFANIGVNLMGSIVNKLDLNKHYGGYYYRYYSYYGQTNQAYGELPATAPEEHLALELEPKA